MFQYLANRVNSTLLFLQRFSSMVIKETLFAKSTKSTAKAPKAQPKKQHCT
jgi:hypothetical protein